MTRDTACNVCYNCQFIYAQAAKKNSYRFIKLIEILIMNHDESVIQGAQTHKIIS